jgi:hypothetical protein
VIKLAEARFAARPWLAGHIAERQFWSDRKWYPAVGEHADRDFLSRFAGLALANAANKYSATNGTPGL